MIWLTVIVFVGLLLVLVLVHEWGHFWAARRAGCRVEEFAFGFPPRLWSFKKGETTYSFNALPIGGYVKIEGEDMQDMNPGPGSFGGKSIPWRIVILAAGVVMNLVLAVVLLSVQAGLGVPTMVTEENKNTVTDLQTFVVGIDAGTPAESAGLKELDRIDELDGIDAPVISEVQRIGREKGGQEVEMEVERQGRHITLSIAPRAEWPLDEGPFGIAVQATGLMKVPWWQTPWAGITRTWYMLAAIVSQFIMVLQQLFSGSGVEDALTGPIGIAVYTNEVTNLGISYVLEFAALISINLAIINILPIPALDGGRILFVLMEAIFRKKIPGKIEQISHMTGFALLILLMLVITYKDVIRFFFSA